MFSKTEFEVVGFSPCDNGNADAIVESKKTFQESTSQTEKEQTDGECQVKARTQAEVQTEEIVKDLNTDYNVDNLASFLNRVCPNVIEELNKVEKSKAFTLYKTVKEERSDNSVKVAHTICSETIPQIPGVQVSCVAWSCTENVVSLGYGSFEHQDWCTHASCVDFYNIKTSDFDGKTPNYSIPTSSCVTSLATHPYEPAIIAVGTTGGEVHVWNLQKGQFDADMGNSIFHEDKVTKLSWENMNSQLYLVSSSSDSYIFFYKVTPSISSVILTERYSMTNDISHLRAGITTFGFSVQAGVFLVGLESGEIIHCSTFGAPNIPSSTAKNPVLRTICKRTALIMSIKFSPFIEHIFAASFTDNRVETYSLKGTTPLHVIYLDFDVMGHSWSLTQGNIFFIWGKSSALHVYNSETARQVTEIVPDTNSLPNIKVATFCSKSSRLAVSGDEGKVMVWDIPNFFRT